ncbi:hypothetical protein AAHB53_29270 [Niallia circulans]
MLFDVGDVIKGSPLAEYVANSPMFYSSDIHPAYKSMNLMGYDAATVGNHEFNFGLDFLLNTLIGADFPIRMLIFMLMIIMDMNKMIFIFSTLSTIR